MTPTNSSSRENPGNDGDRSALVDGALDALVFAPLGLAELARSDYAALVKAGRQTVRRQVSAARVLGRLAIGQGRGEVDRRGKQVRSALETLAKPVMEMAGLDSDGDHQGEGGDGPSAAKSPRPINPTPSATMGQGDALAIPDYDSLAAAQVVQRLAGLSKDELEAISAYEATTRKRRTILSKTRQLLDAESS